MIIERICITVILLISVYLVPWWAIVAAAVVCIFFISYYGEVVLVSGFLDILYGTHALTWPIPWFTITAVILLVAVGYMKAQFRARVSSSFL